MRVKRTIIQASFQKSIMRYYHVAEMSAPRKPRDVFLALVNGLCDGQFDDVLKLYAERTDISHPFDPLHGHRLTSRAELAEHFSRRPVRKTLAARPSNINIHETSDPEVIVAEFAYAGSNLETGAAFSYPCIFVMRVRDGEIVESRDYVDHLGSAEARGGLAALLAEIGKRRLINA
jgi:ketosteroid isomerase-like protein